MGRPEADNDTAPGWRAASFTAEAAGEAEGASAGEAAGAEESAPAAAAPPPLALVLLRRPARDEVRLSFAAKAAWARKAKVRVVLGSSCRTSTTDPVSLAEEADGAG